MVIAEVVAIAGVLTSIFTGLYGLFKRKQVKTVTEALDIVSEGLVFVEDAIDDNKGAGKELKQLAGDKVIETIKSYGPDVREAVTLARMVANTIQSK